MTLSEAEAAERAAFAATGRHGEREFERVRCWIASGCEGEQPKPDQEARCKLTDDLVAAVAVREGAERAAGGRGVRSAPALPVGEIAATGPRCGAEGPCRRVYELIDGGR